MELEKIEQGPLLICTMDGHLYALNSVNGGILWKIVSNLALISVSQTSDSMFSYIVEPTGDGQIFMATHNSQIKKLPFTVKKLVDIAPFRSPDDTLYLGYKKTEIVRISFKDGIIEKVFQWNSQRKESNIIPADDLGIYVARTEYNILIFEPGKNDMPSYIDIGLFFVNCTRWNVTMHKYHSPDGQKVREFDANVVLLPGLDGSLVAWKQSAERMLWSQKLGSIAVAAMSTKFDSEGKSFVIDVKLGRDQSETSSVILSTIGETPFVLKAEVYHKWTINEAKTDVTLSSIKSLKSIQLKTIEPDCSPGHAGYPNCLTNRDERTLYMVPTISETIDMSPKLLIDPPSDKSYTATYTVVLALFVIVLTALYFVAKNKRSKAIKKKKRGKRNTVSKEGGSLGDLIISDHVLGYGSNGTVVMKGSFQGRTVAIKRLLVEFYDYAENEISLLLHSDNHFNVIRYFCVEKTSIFIYIALDLCAGSLHDLFDSESPLYHSPEITRFRETHTPVICFEDILNGLNFLHSLNIVHRDVKPHNILIKMNDLNESKLVLSDFGLCRRLTEGQTSFNTLVNRGAGSYGWRAPEILLALTNEDAEAKYTKALDTFSAGLILYYILSNGGHPFGDSLVRENNIILGKSDLSSLGWQNVVERDLISLLIKSDPHMRPSTSECLRHPVFWSLGIRLSFLQELSDRLDVEDRQAPIYRGFESFLEHVACNWIDKVDNDLFDNMGKYRKYDENSPADLLRAIRNKKNHYQDLPDTVKLMFGKMPDGYYNYFMKRFPTLFIDAYNFVMANEELANDSVFATFLQR